MANPAAELAVLQSTSGVGTVLSLTILLEIYTMIHGLLDIAVVACTALIVGLGALLYGYFTISECAPGSTYAVN